jgi:tetratricopeptide (TPR) repeat protein
MAEPTGRGEGEAMTRRQKLLAALVAAEAVALGGWGLRNSLVPTRPAIRTEALDAETAREIARLAAALRPDRFADWLRLAEVCRAFNLLADADYCYRQADRVSPTETAHLFDWAATLSRMGETRRAAPLFERVVALGGPQADECRLMLARDRLREEDVGAAETALRQIKNSPHATVLLARLLIRTGRAAEAKAMLDGWLQGAPDELHAQQMRAWAAAELGDIADARAHRMIALRCRDWAHATDSTTAHDEEVRQQFGRSKLLAKLPELEAQAKWDEAAGLLRQALAISWNDQDVGRLAAIEMRAGRPRRAIEELERLITATGATGETLLAIGRVRLAEGNVQMAWEAGLRAEELGANFSAIGNLNIQQFLIELSTRRNDANALHAHQGRAQLELAKVAWADNNVAQAHQQLLQASARWPDQAAIWFYLGETSAVLGDVSGARRSYERCLQLNPNHGRAVEALAQLR